MSIQSSEARRKLEEASFDGRDYIDARLAELKYELKSEIGGVKGKMMKWLASLYVAACTLAVIFTILLVTK